MTPSAIAPRTHGNRPRSRDGGAGNVRVRELALDAACDRTGEPWEAEYRFHPVRKWRFDRAFPAAKVAVEVDGGVWTGGRHVRPVGYQRDLEKLNAAVSLGWRVLRVTWKEVGDGTLERLLITTLAVVLREDLAEVGHGK